VHLILFFVIASLSGVEQSSGQSSVKLLGDSCL
jgi:hypothetical protein